MMKKSRIRRLYLADYLITPDHIIPNGGVLCEMTKSLPSVVFPVLP